MCSKLIYYALVSLLLMFLISPSKNDTIRSRPLIIGDTFSAAEMLPIAIRLRKKVENPGLGKGFVSSTKTPEELADKLFQAFFSTSKRNGVILKDTDIPSLDALQALALKGEENNHFEVPVTDPGRIVHFRGQYVLFNQSLRRSNYKLVTKKVNLELNGSVKRQGIPIAKKLQKKRRLVINKRYGGLDLFPSKANKNESGLKEQKNTVNSSRGEGIKNSSCRWIYSCNNPSDLDTCYLKAHCNKASVPTASIVDIDSEEITTRKSTFNVDQFRKMMGLTLIDEEVEKILEVRNLSRPGSRNITLDERLEKLSRRFNELQKLYFETSTIMTTNNDL